MGYVKNVINSFKECNIWNYILKIKWNIVFWGDVIFYNNYFYLIIDDLIILLLMFEEIL